MSGMMLRYHDSVPWGRLCKVESIIVAPYVVITPEVAWGQARLDGTGIPVDILLTRHVKGGASVKELADDCYRQSAKRIMAGLDYAKRVWGQ